MIDEASMLDRLQSEPCRLPPLRVEFVEPQPGPNSADPQADAIVELAWDEQRFRFVAELKRLATPRMLRDAVAQAQRLAAATGLYPLVVVPYLAPEQLQMLEREGVSGIDLSGNGVVIVPGELLVYRTGQPNAYPASAGIRNVYTGVSSLVARVFLLKSAFDAVGDVRQEIERRDGAVSPGTVSKVLKQLEEDLIIRRDGRASRLIQPDRLLEKLAAGFRWPDARERRQFQWRGERSSLDRALAEAARAADVRLTRTGAASVERYAVMPREKQQRCYTTNLKALINELGDRIAPGERFPDLELIQTADPLAYFDRRAEDGELPWASPLQAWLELQAGDKRERDAAEQVRQTLRDAVESG